jgi:hypothetical protein
MSRARLVITAIAYAARPKAAPGADRLADTHDRLCQDKIDKAGCVTLRVNGRLHHIGVGRTHSETHVLLLVQDHHIRVIHAATGELLRELVLDPTRGARGARLADSAAADPRPRVLHRLAVPAIPDQLAGQRQRPVHPGPGLARPRLRPAAPAARPRRGDPGHGRRSRRAPRRRLSLLSPRPPRTLFSPRAGGPRAHRAETSGSAVAVRGRRWATSSRGHTLAVRDAGDRPETGPSDLRSRRGAAQARSRVALAAAGGIAQNRS